jgi:3-oxoacyl-[acyl-carrier protein] reductase
MSNELKILTGKVALVTGGSRGIGAAIARRLANDGAAVAITYVSARAKADDVVAAIVASGGRAVALQADSADAAAIEAAVATTVSTFGGFDILVNSAGVAIMNSIEDFTLEDFDRTIAINVRAVFVGIKAAVPHLTAGGRIITIGSTNADRMPFAGGGVYSMSKAAIAGLTRGLSRDLGPRGITINNVQPGPVATDMNPADGPFADTLHGFMAIPRHGTGGEIASLVAYLVGPEAAYITGASLTIDGGFAA